MLAAGIKDSEQIMSDTDSNDDEWEMEEEGTDDDDLSDAEYARRLQLLEDAQAAAEDHPDIIPFDKGYEVCCFVCRCRKCDEVSGDKERVRTSRFDSNTNHGHSSPLTFNVLVFPTRNRSLKCCPRGNHGMSDYIASVVRTSRKLT
jgi:hypothetical protein